MDGAAFDIAMSNHDPVAFEAAAREVGFLGFGFYPSSGFIHVDLGPARHWGERFPVRETVFASETPPAREVLAESRKMKDNITVQSETGSNPSGCSCIGQPSVAAARPLPLRLC